VNVPLPNLAAPAVAPTKGGDGPFAFSLRDVGFTADGGTVLLRPLSLTLGYGEVHGLIGQNGSGKTTLVKLLARQHAASTGAIGFAGQPLANFRPRAFAREVAYLPQSLPPAVGLTVRELTELGRYAWHGALGRFTAEHRRHVTEALELTGMASFEDRLVDSLSGGERQRAWLAMLVAQNARCLLLDEPISALDIGHQLEILALVRELARSRQLCVIAVLHDVNMAARFCDQLIALRAGELVAQGIPDHIVTPAALKIIYGVDMRVTSHPDTGTPVAFAA
jgi:iron-chelate-transporting ATPase